MKKSPYARFGDDYRPPTGKELRTYLRAKEMTVAAMAEDVGVNPRTARRWCSDVEPRTIPYAAWKLLIQLRGGHSL